MGREITERILNSMDVLIYGIHYDTYKIVEGNWKMRQRFSDFRPGEMCYKLLHGREAPCDSCPLERVRKGERDVRVSLTIGRDDQWIQVMFNDFELDDGEHICLCTGVDITGVKESVRMTENVLNGIRAAAYSVEMGNYRIRSVNFWLKEQLPGIKEGDLCYRALWDEDKPCDHCPIPRLSTDHPTENIERYNNKLGRYLSIDSVLVKGVARDDLVVFTGYDITRQVVSEKRLENIAFRDTLSGLGNRSAFMECLSQRFAGGGVHQICVMNIKNFDHYNLVYGRVAGDALLRECGRYLGSSYGQDRVFRVGGSKFALVAGTEEELLLMEKLLQESLPAIIAERYKNFRFYIGGVVIEIPRFASNPEAAIHNAEYMLRKNKNVEESEVTVFHSKDQNELVRRGQISAILRKKIKSNDLRVYYQPIYSIEENAFTKCEALARLYDEHLGWISPAEFIPIAEESGLIHQLGTSVLDQACALVERRQREGLAPVQVNVNVSTVQFSSQNFYESVLEILNSHTIDRKLIHLEVTESIMINSLEYIVDIMKKLIEQGIQFAVDDFGTGYSSLNYIGTLPVAGIKLDKSFVDKIAQSEVYVLIVKNIMEIAKGLHFKIVAEGVEDFEQYRLLKRLGCDYIQGFLFSRPLPLPEFERFLAGSHTVRGL